MIQKCGNHLVLEKNKDLVISFVFSEDVGNGPCELPGASFPSCSVLLEGKWYSNAVVLLDTVNMY